ncbi:CBD9-like protein [Mytilinidion resinicola]|uniref:CBD9-like protein n=1 Tax=Mytilinidion resinicola TaxID=574789 RepID=A0A6A6YWT6_9PEZI|nr:CBD9-like protein [Mytilinidion resinicola]KAF2812367.1 CBD9-like protein [Mytilinidion resinicola]
MKLSTILLRALALGASAQQSSSYTDSKSGITFQTHTETAGFAFGIALPETPSTDSISLLVGKGTGCAGVSLAGPMINSLLIVAWPSGTSLLQRDYRTYGSPAEANGTFAVTPIVSGTYINSTHYTHTFLRRNCIASDGTTFASNSSVGVIGWAMSTTALVSASNHAPSLNHHANQGNHGVNFEAANSADYATWAALAGNGSARTEKAC